MGKALPLALAVCIAIVIVGAYFAIRPHPSLTNQGISIQTTTTTSTTVNTQSQPPPLKKPVLKRKMIELSVTDSTIIYVERDYYEVTGPSQYGSLCQSLTSNLTEEVKRMYFTIVKYGNLSTLCIRSNSSVIVTVSFQVYGKMWVSNGEVYADFLWFLTPNHLDFIQSQFNETTSGLTWQGTINGVNTYIEVRLPHQSTPYKAWGEPVGHCHGHAWWPKGG
jgi:hypothetical protein